MGLVKPKVNSISTEGNLPVKGDVLFTGPGVSQNGNTFTFDGTAGEGAHFIEGAIPDGTINGTNEVFALSQLPTIGSLKVFLNGLRLTNNVDYTLANTTLTLMIIPFPGDVLLVDFRY